MRVKYICLCCGDNKSGVNKKILSQIEQLSKNGVDISGYSLCEYNDCNAPHPLVSHIHIPGIQRTTTIFQKLKRDYFLMEAIEDIIVSSHEDDVIYLRHRFPYLKFLRILRNPRLCTVVLEFQTIEPIEARLTGRYWYIILDILYGRAIRTWTDAFVGVTDEITQYQLSRISDGDKPHITIGNGIDVASVPLRTAPEYNEEELRLLCVATVSRWHGLDRLLRGIRMYKGQKNVTLHIVGDGDELMNLRELSIELTIQEKVIFHSYSTGEALDCHFSRCHIGVGSLGIHRKGLHETSELKAREYCSRGIPYINAAEDNDYPSDFRYILRLPPDESPINIDHIISFADIVLADPSHPQQMRQYAENQLDWSVKIQQLKTFLVDQIETKMGKYQ